MAPAVLNWPNAETPRRQLLEWVGNTGLMMVAATRLRRAAELAVQHGVGGPDLSNALAAFDRALPGLVRFRNIAEHFDDYALGRGRHTLDPPVGVRPSEVLTEAERLYATIVEAAGDPTPRV
ncbi:MAG TPA: hypothetical protein VF134_05200 [Candidatus Dormibacteraeota bacterium]